jgi:hypothetical protein
MSPNFLEARTRRVSTTYPKIGGFVPGNFEKNGVKVEISPSIFSKTGGRGELKLLRLVAVGIPYVGFEPVCPPVDGDFSTNF